MCKYGLWGRNLTVILALVGVVQTEAQVGLFVEHGGTSHLVRKIEGTTLMFEREGKWLKAERTAKTSLRALNEFLPFVVQLKNVQATSLSQEFTYSDRSSGQHGVELTFSAEIESPYLLEDVFLLLKFPSRTSILTAQRGVGTLLPGQTHKVSLRVPTGMKLGGQPFEVHLFSDGMELLHSGQPEAFREKQLDRIVARRSEGVRNREVQPLVGPDPLYPGAALGRPLRGEAVVRLRVTREGAARDVELVSSTAPEFGPPAIAAAKQWRFLPLVIDGVVQEKMVELPFSFDPPLESRK